MPDMHVINKQLMISQPLLLQCRTSCSDHLKSPSAKALVSPSSPITSCYIGFLCEISRVRNVFSLFAFLSLYNIVPVYQTSEPPNWIAVSPTNQKTHWLNKIITPGHSSSQAMKGKQDQETELPTDRYSSQQFGNCCSSSLFALIRTCKNFHY